MEQEWSDRIDGLLSEFLLQDDLRQLTLDTGMLLQYPLLVLDDTFHVRAHFLPPSFSDEVFRNAVRCGEITYEAGAVISKSPALSGGTADYIKLVDSVDPRRVAPLISAGVRLGYLVCVDTDGHLREIPDDVWLIVSRILAKQLFVETSRQDRPFETAQDILMHLLDGGFQSAPYFWLQAAGTYLADFHPSAFALIDLTAYHNLYLGKRHLKDEVNTRFPDSHSFLYRGDVFLFLPGDGEKSGFADVVKEFQLKVVISEGLGDLFSLPALYRTAHEALELMRDERFHSGNICTVAQLRTPLLLKNLELRGDLISRDVQRLAAHDRERNTQYCETLYHYLTCSRSLKKTCDALFTHRNTVLYRIRRMQEEFRRPLDEPSAHADLLLSVSLVLFQQKGPDFFLCTAGEAGRPEQEK